MYFLFSSENTFGQYTQYPISGRTDGAFDQGPQIYQASKGLDS